VGLRGGETDAGEIVAGTAKARRRRRIRPPAVNMRYNDSMAILDLYSRRKRRREKAGQPDVYQYDDIPRPLRVQIIQIWREAIGPGLPPDPYGISGYYEPPNSEDRWKEIHAALAREKGMFVLAKGNSAFEQCAKYLLGVSNIDDALDVIEVTFRTIYAISQMKAQMREYEWDAEASRRGITLKPEDAISELNFRFREAGLGYQFENGKIVRVDSQYVHAEAVKPALALLSDDRFRGAHEEFLHAHLLYRTAGLNEDKKREDAITDALKALESTLKVICDLKKWQYPANVTAVPLIKIVIQNGLIPPFLQSSMEGLATLRNNIGGHGQGGKTRSVPPHLAAYALHMCASNIVMLVEAFKESEPRP